MCFCFGGIVLVILFADEIEKELEAGEEVKEDTNNTSLTLGVFAAMTAIFFFGVSAVATRRL